VTGDDRPTLAFPTRSGVLGLVAACMGIQRREHARLVELAADARVHIRVDAQGTRLVDDQTIQFNPRASASRQTIQSKRTYLCDASFVAVIIPGRHTSCQAIADAVRQPVFAPFLGRRACVISTPLLISEALRGQDELELFHSVPRGPEALLSALDDQDETSTFYLDLDHHPQALRRLMVRDYLAGPLPRQWRERPVVQVNAKPAALPS